MNKKNSAFRNWCVEKYYEHKKEVLLWERHVCTDEMSDYFGRSKYFLKSLYKKEILGYDNKVK